MSKPFGSGSVTVQPSRGLCQASYLGQKVTYSEARFGAMAETLAHRALLKLQAGNFDPVSDDLQFKQSQATGALIGPTAAVDADRNAQRT